MSKEEEEEEEEEEDKLTFLFLVLYCIEKPQLCKEEYANIKTQNKINNYQKPEIK